MADPVGLERRLRAAIRDIPDFPKPGIIFKDITPVLSDPDLFGDAIEGLLTAVSSADAEVVVGIESRGFLFGAPLALRLGLPFVPVRKRGKLPSRTVRVEYALEYGTDALEAHEDAILEGQRVLVVDDLLATGGTAAATGELVGRIGAAVVASAFVVELGFLKGRERLGDGVVHSLVRFDRED